VLTTPKNKEILIGIVAGEPSGDLLGAELILALKSRIPNVRFVGIGGPKMIAAGVQSLFPIDALSVRGIVEVLFHLLRILKIRRSLLRYFLVERPKVFIGVDAPDFNLGLEYQLKKSGIPTVHYISPSIWAWRGYRINKIIESVSLMLTVFPFEEEIYKNKNLPATYVGHPLADLLPIESSQADARKEFNVTTTAIVITLMPGSRMSELSALGEVFIKTAYMISSAFKNTHFLVPLATQQTYDFFHSILGLNVNNNIHIQIFQKR
jgi:lipid-A-disaccharide synthase